jgi:uncharacterized protein with HEPN domain
MPKSDIVYVGHMLDTAKRALRKTRNKTRRDFDHDDNLRLAVAHLIQTVGEAARRVSPEFQEAHPDIPWRDVVGMRHKIVHDYLEVDYDIVWDVETTELPPLVKKLKRLLPDE